ncbi:MAG: hypothetical protein AB7F89_00485 [Pirellulaceae bacterium]
MKMRTVGAAVLIVCVAGTWVVRAQQEPAPPANLFMVAKLDHAKKVLEGLTMEKFDVIARHAQAMALLSQEQAWRVIQTEEYLQRSVEFRRSIDMLTEAAKKKNLDGATLAYVDATMKCIECHKYVRHIRHAARTPELGSPTRLR